MFRYFIELAYKGTNYSGFQTQQNANTIQREVEKAFQIIHRHEVKLTGSSRTDAGVHSLQNYFHFDFEQLIHPKFTYKMNALLPRDIVIKNIYQMPSEAHCRFDAISREYEYNIHNFKNPFLDDTSFYYPYKIDLEKIKLASALLLGQNNFYSFCKTNSQAKSFNCKIEISQWTEIEHGYRYEIKSNRFLRGMVRMITGTLLTIGRGKMTMNELEQKLSKNEKIGYIAPAQGLILKKVIYPENYFPKPGKSFTAF